jgi:hypothetical protein
MELAAPSQVMEYWYYFDMNEQERLKEALQLFEDVQNTPFRIFNSCQ